jgi:hypothetical protein
MITKITINMTGKIRANSTKPWACTRLPSFSSECVRRARTNLSNAIPTYPLAYHF